MQINGPGPVQGPQSIQGTNRTHQAQATPSRPHFLEADQLDISHEADFLSRVRELPEIRADRVADIKAQIEAGTYETEQKLDVAVDRLLDELA